MNFEGFPAIIGLELTLRCNLFCKHCASSAGKPRPNELATAEMIAICNQFPDLLVQEVDLTGGEPLMRDDWFTIASRLRTLNIPVRMVTNGILLKENINRIQQAEVKTIGVSFDGLEKIHDHIRDKKGLFRHIVEGVKATLGAGIPVAAITSVNDQNIGDLAGLKSFLCDLGIKYWQLQPLFAAGRANQKGLTLSEKTFIKLGEFIYASKTACASEIIDLVAADGVGYFTELDTKDRQWKGCGAGFSSCGITADGKVKGCLSLPDSCIEGDLRKQSLWQTWFDKNAFAYNRQFNVEKLGNNCGECAYGQQCRGGCTVMSYSATGRFHNNPYCFHGIGEKAVCGR